MLRKLENIVNAFYQKPFRFLAFFFIISLCLWSFASLSLHSLQQPSLDFPADKDLKLQLKTDLLVKSNTIKENYQTQSYTLEAICRGKLISSEEGANLYRFNWEYLKVTKEGLKQDLFLYELLDKAAIRYRCSEELSEKQRKEIFDFFGIDVQSKEFSQDQSFLRKSFELNLGERGSFGPLKLHPAFRRSISRATDSSLSQPIIFELIDDSKNIISWLPKITRQKRWRSRGEFLVPLLWQHERFEGEGPIVKTVIKSYKDEVLKKWVQRPFLQDLRLTKNNWKLECDVDRKQQRMKNLKAEIDLELQNQLLDQKIIANYQAIVNVGFKWIEPQDVILERQDLY
ncbi:MAG: hypothetical protein L7U87_06565 [Chlamydiales bacterium]|nr:hypothetical protein [Chlamydiales bacterium]